MRDERVEGMRERLEAREADADEAPKSLRTAIDILREEVEVRPAWRDALEAALEGDGASGEFAVSGNRGAPTLRAGRPVWSGWRAAAAAVLLLAAGAVGGSVATRYVLLSEHSSPSLAPASVLGGNADRVSVRFTIMAPTARHVALVGDFNGWSATETPLVRQPDAATWVAIVPLPRGRHAYSFVIDGDVVADPAAPPSADDDFGVPSSVILVSATR